MITFDKNGKLIVKNLKKLIKHEEGYPFDDADLFDGNIDIKYEEDD